MVDYLSEFAREVRADVERAVKATDFYTVLPTRLQGLKFSERVSAISEVRLYLFAREKVKLTPFVYHPEREEVLEPDGKIGEMVYKDLFVYHELTKTSSIVADITAIVVKIVLALNEAGESVEYGGVDVLGIYLVKAPPVSEIIREIIRDRPWMSSRDISRELREMGIRVSADVITRYSRYYRREYWDKYVRYLERVSRDYLGRHPTASRGDLVRYLRMSGISIPREADRIISGIYTRYSRDNRVKYIRSVMRRLAKSRDIHTPSRLIKVYREEGYRGADKLLRQIAKEVIASLRK